MTVHSAASSKRCGLTRWSAAWSGIRYVAVCMQRLTLRPRLRTPCRATAASTQATRCATCRSAVQRTQHDWGPGHVSCWPYWWTDATCVQRHLPCVPEGTKPIQSRQRCPAPPPDATPCLRSATRSATRQKGLRRQGFQLSACACPRCIRWPAPCAFHHAMHAQPPTPYPSPLPERLDTASAA